ncbi:hypothetical protein IFM89_018058 [Coptis chinensis]|uniref:Uncharacterized protein n=1 Tax=Coptis chinensis TaxID=261450 RepID=A0A835HTL2_9MAGN|nr:hypothetical protein IFM89_018058 [Coptis chinensis]
MTRTNQTNLPSTMMNNQSDLGVAINSTNPNSITDANIPVNNAESTNSVLMADAQIPALLVEAQLPPNPNLVDRNTTSFNPMNTSSNRSPIFQFSQFPQAPNLNSSQPQQNQVMSAQDEVSVVVKCLKLGAADYLAKPLRTNELLNLWTHMWRRRQMLGLSEKKILNYDFDMVASDPSDANTNSTTVFSDDTDEKSRRSTILENSILNNREAEDLVMAEKLLMKHIDAPGRWLQERHRRLLLNKFCGRYFRDKNLHRFIIYDEQIQDKFEHNRRLRNPVTTAIQQAIHGLSYTVYGKADVRRLMFEVFDFEQIQPKEV